VRYSNNEKTIVANVSNTFKLRDEIPADLPNASSEAESVVSN
jgi:hypothetical protein